MTALAEYHAAELAQLRATGTLRVLLSLDCASIMDREGRGPLLPVLRYWKTVHPVMGKQNGIMWHVRAEDPTTGQLYQGRGRGPGYPLTLRPKAGRP